MDPSFSTRALFEEFRGVDTSTASRSPASRGVRRANRVGRFAVELAGGRDPPESPARDEAAPGNDSTILDNLTDSSAFRLPSQKQPLAVAAAAATGCSGASVTDWARIRW